MLHPKIDDIVDVCVKGSATGNEQEGSIVFHNVELCYIVYHVVPKMFTLLVHARKRVCL